MQTEATRGDWFVGVEPARTAPRSRPRVERSRDEATGRLALAAVLALGLLVASVLAAVVALVPVIYTPFF